VDRAAPLLGQDNAAVLTELGYSDAEQRTLKDQGVV
jgi:crotonobetainyl-CoA:carnitine CoA-transferase CaiB-like acyl-CoA transferase